MKQSHSLKINDLPTEILVRIASFVANGKDLCSLFVVAKLFANIKGDILKNHGDIHPVIVEISKTVKITDTNYLSLFVSRLEQRKQEVEHEKQMKRKTSTYLGKQC